MREPERIHIVLNAADGYERFLECGMNITHTEDLTRERVITMLGAQAGKLFRLFGWVDETAPAVALRIMSETDDRLQIQGIEPPFSAAYYEVTSEPPLQVTEHGDYCFDLVRV
jgi:hypothetical protein